MPGSRQRLQVLQGCRPSPQQGLWSACRCCSNACRAPSRRIGDCRSCVQVLSEDHACIRVAVEQGTNEGYQFKTHPNIDKGLYSARSVLGLKDVDRPFPTGSPLGILKWRMQARPCWGRANGCARG